MIRWNIGGMKTTVLVGNSTLSENAYRPYSLTSSERFSVAELGRSLLVTDVENPQQVLRLVIGRPDQRPGQLQFCYYQFLTFSNQPVARLLVHDTSPDALELPGLPGEAAPFASPLPVHTQARQMTRNSQEASPRYQVNQHIGSGPLPVKW